MGSPEDSRSVFVVHGRNEALRKSMFDFLRSIGLEPIEWTKAVAMTGEGSPYVGEVLNAAFGVARAVVVLLTPDEVAYLQTQHAHGEEDPESHPAPQARPNVLFEAGMALGRDPKRTVLVEVGKVRPFSDIAGRHTIRLTNSTETRQALANRLKTAGCAVDLTGTDWHTVGDFTAPEPPGGGLPLGRRIPSISSRPLVDLDAQFVRSGGNKIDKLRIVNRGSETAYDVQLTIPDGAALRLYDPKAIAKIPGGGKSVTLDAHDQSRYLGGGTGDVAFDIMIAARTEAGDIVEQDVFLDLNG